MSGASARYFYPLTGTGLDTMGPPYDNFVNWENSTADTYACYTLTTGDTFAGCSQHGGGTLTSTSKNALNYQRLLDY